MTPGDRLDGTTIARLVHAAAAGSEAAFVELTSGLGGVVWAQVRAFGLSPADGDDVVQGVWLRLAQNLAKIREPEKLPGWLATTARNECRVVVRRAARPVPALLQTDASRAVVPDASADIEHRERRDAVHAGLAALDARCLELLSLLSVDPPIPYEQIAESMAMPVASIGPTRGRCIDKLRRTKPLRVLLGDPDDDPGIDDAGREASREISRTWRGRGHSECRRR
jgi:RNA polymerase sigma factor (sigma-70 family)